jgi:hypothetical protein
MRYLTFISLILWAFLCTESDDSLNHPSPQHVESQGHICTESDDSLNNPSPQHVESQGYLSTQSDDSLDHPQSQHAKQLYEDTR